MSGGRLYAVTALFRGPDEVLRAVEGVRRAGYVRFDVHTPYPLHGMDAAMGLKNSPLGYAALVFGLLGAAAGVGLMSWVTLADYPLVIGGKPFWSWPAFVPVAFEITVLLASVCTVALMVVFFFRFPNLGHPLHGSSYMRRVSSDGFGIALQASDPRFDGAGAEKLLRGLGGTEVEAVFLEEDTGRGVRVLAEPRFLLALVAVGVVTSGGTYLALNRIAFLEPFNWMMQQARLNAQDPSSFFADGRGLRLAVPGTVPRGFLPYPLTDSSAEAAGRVLINPLAPSEDVLARGRDRYRTFCSPCHGNFGGGDSRLRGQFPNPPTLHSDKVKAWPDGALYHVMTRGQNIMPSYAAQISRDDRWAVALYVRALLRAQSPREGDRP
ncbi:MAG: quinol:electron acceptor oxidoreductase subunit ActD [Bacteroidota bacterium]